MSFIEPNSKDKLIDKLIVNSKIGFFSFLSQVYGLITRFRNYLFDIKILKSTTVPGINVVCVGNVTVGGSAKSPIAQYLAKEVLKAGGSPVILSRGYKGKIKSAHLVTSSDTVETVGDEAIMHFRYGSCPVVVSRKRVAGVKLIQQNNLGDTVILDDGYQHRYLNRNINILCLDISSETAINDWQSGELLPLGKLREELLSAVLRADKIYFVSRNLERSLEFQTAHSLKLIKDLKTKLLEGAKTNPQHVWILEKVLSSIEYSLIQITPGAIIEASSAESIHEESLPNKNVFALSSIAKPEFFYRFLETKGFHIQRKLELKDHEQITQEQFCDVQKVCKNENLTLITTKKDTVKLFDFIDKEEEVFFMDINVEETILG